MKRIFWMIFLIAGILGSCQTQYITKYRVTDTNYREYYTDSFKLTDSTITFKEQSRNHYNTYALSYPYVVEDLTVPNRDTRKYIKELREQGYSKVWATHKALVECGQIPEDDEYLAIQED